MITPLFLISLAKLTLLPGEFSTRTSRLGMASPFCTNAGAVLWKRDACARTRGMLVAIRRANMVIFSGINGRIGLTV